jgi:hypothetical protein
MPPLAGVFAVRRARFALYAEAPARRRRGHRHPLEGGLAAWMTLQYPVQPREAPAVEGSIARPSG